MDGVDILPNLSYREECEHVELLVQKLEHLDAARRRKGAEAMATYIADQRCLPEDMPTHPAKVLADFLDAPRAEKNMCISVAKSLALMHRHAAPYASGALARKLDHTDAELRWEATRALGLLGPEAAAESAEALGRVLLEDEFVLCRLAAARTFELMGEAAAELSAKPLATALMGDEDLDVQTASVRALMVMGPKAAPEAAPELAKVVLTHRYEMKMRACDALFNMGEAAAEHAAPAMVRILRPDGEPWTAGWEPPGSDARLRKRCAEVLGAMGSDTIKKYEVKLSRALGDRDDTVVEASKATLQLAERHRALKGPIALRRGGGDDKPPEIDAADEERSEADLKALKALLKTHKAERIQGWLIKEMGVASPADIALLEEEEIAARGLQKDIVSQVYQAGKVAEERKHLQELLRQHKAHDLLKWLTTEMNVASVADVALLTEDILIEEGPMLEESARELLDAARVRAVELEDEAAAAAEVLKDRLVQSPQMARQKALHSLLEHTRGCICWCGANHDAEAEEEERLAADKQALEDAEALRRDAEEVAEQEFLQRREDRHKQSRRERQAERDAADKKCRDHELWLLNEQDKILELKRQRAEEAKRLAMREGAWLKPGKVFTWAEFSGEDPNAKQESEPEEEEAEDDGYEKGSDDDEQEAGVEEEQAAAAAGPPEAASTEVAAA
eukprot:TRINITY_DN37641_c0_g1_i1.p1 TRINITY_DN37641_c0_g1~~TRINITY_DN37641_c0_g1_i1.p1  ORF type:complete len:680 (+),score=206.72 TRINITY_DN37641_c0_g1_i1:104-2143(+)